MRFLLATAFYAAVLGCGPSRGTVVVGGSGYYGGNRYVDDSYQPGDVDVDSYALP